MKRLELKRPELKRPELKPVHAWTAAGLLALLTIFLSPGAPRFLVIGIIQGSIIGLLAIGIVLVYKGSRVFNFAQAEFGTLAAFFLYMGVETFHFPYILAIIFSIVVTGGIGFLMERIIVRPLFNAPRVTLLVATAGVALLMIALELTLGGRVIRSVRPIINTINGSRGITLFGGVVTWQQIISIAVLAAIAALLAYFFNKTDLGLAVLATSQESVATELVGISTKRISAFVWTLAAVLGAVAGIMQAPDTTFTPAFMTSNYLLLGFTAAVVGGITSLSGAFVGGQLIGIISAISSYIDGRVLEGRIEINAFPELVVFIVLLSILTVRPQGLLGSEA